MTDETADYVARIIALEHLANQLEAIVIALQQRLAAAEQGVAGKWFA